MSLEYVTIENINVYIYIHDMMINTPCVYIFASVQFLVHT